MQTRDEVSTLYMVDDADPKHWTECLFLVLDWISRQAFPASLIFTQSLGLLVHLRTEGISERCIDQFATSSVKKLAMRA